MSNVLITGPRWLPYERSCRRSGGRRLGLRGSDDDQAKIPLRGGADARALIPAYKSQEFESFKDGTLSRLSLTDWEGRP
jgi:hypothetical protein